VDASQQHSRPVESITRRRFGLAAGGLLASLLAVTDRFGLAAARGRRRDHLVRAQFESVDDSGVGGFTILRQLKKEEGTAILVLATGLEPGTEYVSLYYDNDTCELEPYSEDDVIGDTYVANAAGIGHTRGAADDDLDEINSVSVRLAEGFTLVACAQV
jgi:hypothetical protein